MVALHYMDVRGGDITWIFSKTDAVNGYLPLSLFPFFFPQRACKDLLLILQKWLNEWFWLHFKNLSSCNPKRMMSKSWSHSFYLFVCLNLLLLFYILADGTQCFWSWTETVYAWASLHSWVGYDELADLNCFYDFHLDFHELWLYYHLQPANARTLLLGV